MKELKELLTPKRDDLASVVKIVAEHSDTAFVVQDIRKKRYIVESDGSYRIGQTVVVQSGIITGIAKSLSTFKEFVI